MVKRVCYWQCERCYKMVLEESGETDDRYVVEVKQERGRFIHPIPARALCQTCFYDVDRVLRACPADPAPVATEATEEGAA